MLAKKAAAGEQLVDRMRRYAGQVEAIEDTPTCDELPGPGDYKQMADVIRGFAVAVERQQATIQRIQAKSARRRRALRGLHKSYMLMDRWCQVARVRARALSDGEGAALAYELQGRVDALEGHVSRERKKVKGLQAKLDRVAPCVCPECGPNVAVDEDGCCVTCGADAAVGGFRVNDLTNDQIRALEESESGR